MRSIREARDKKSLFHMHEHGATDLIIGLCGAVETLAANEGCIQNSMIEDQALIAVR